MLDTARIRADFPLLRQLENGHRLVYLDNAATTQKPEAVLGAIADYYRTTNANVHRGAYDLAVRATEAYEAARASVARFVNAWAPEGVVFTRGTTEAINLVASSYGRANVRAGDTVVVTAMDHHSNLVPWQILCEEKGATVIMVEITEDGRLDLADYGRALERRPKIVAFPYVSNALGTVNPVAQLVRLAHAAGAVTVVDGAQSTPHLRVDVQALDCDFYALSGHKMLGPMGSGALVAKPALLDAMPPYQGGGEMISRVWDDHSTYNQIPHKFEAGTPNVEGAVGLAAAIAYLEAWARPDRRARGRVGARGDRAAESDRRHHTLRPPRPSRRRGVVHLWRHPSARPRHHRRPGRDLHPGGSSLHAALDATPQRRGHGPGILLHLQRPRRHRRPRGVAGQGGSAVWIRLGLSPDSARCTRS